MVGEYPAMAVESVVNLDLIVKTCKANLSYRTEGQEQERASLQLWMRLNVLPNVLRMSGLGGEIE